jgi:CBS domain-containing protein
MAATVKEIMNPELFHLRPGDSGEDALHGLLALGITGAPVLGEDGRPAGMVSLRELAQRRTGQTAADIMGGPAATVRAEAPVSEAGRLLGETGHHRLVVVDADGRALGNVSALDVLRALLDLPAAHPAPFPHFDPATRLVWTDPRPLALDAIDAAPDGAGLFVLIRGGAGVPEHVVWAEACHHVYARLTDILSTPQTDRPVLAWWLARGPLRFRAAAVDDPELGKAALRRMLSREGVR